MYVLPVGIYSYFYWRKRITGEIFNGKRRDWVPFKIAFYTRIAACSLFIEKGNVRNHYHHYLVVVVDSLHDDHFAVIWQMQQHHWDTYIHFFPSIFLLRLSVVKIADIMAI